MDRRVFAASLIILLVAAPAVSTLGTPPPADPPAYQVEDLGTTSDGFVPTVTGMNASGQVSGYVSRPDGLRAVRYTNGTGWAYLPGLEAVYSAATAINANGDLTGYFFGAAGFRAFRYVDGPGVTTIDALLPDGTMSFGMGIAANGDVVGYGDTSAGNRAWRASPGMNPVVPTGLAVETSSACGVNDAGQMVGSFVTAAGYQHAFRLETDGTRTDIGTLQGPSSMSAACALDADGLVGGNASLGDASHAFVWSGGALIDIDAFASSFSYVTAVRNGVAVGAYRFSETTGETHAFVYSAAFGTSDLNTRIPVGSGWTLTEANAVNANGQIVGLGVVAGGANARVFRLTPGAAADTTAPVISSVTADPLAIWPPKGQMVTVTASATATDDSGAAPTCTLASITLSGALTADASVTGPNTGTVKAVGGRTYAFNETCTDGSGNSATGSVNVTVTPDVTAPLIAALTATPSSVPPNGAMVPVALSVSATDDVDDAPSCALAAITSAGAPAGDFAIAGPLSATVRAVSGRTYSLRVACSDAAGNSRDASVDVVVPADTTAPVITAVSASPDHIWPPNHQMEQVTLSVTATDNLDSAPQCSLTSITGAPAGSFALLGALTANVRADKDNVYTLNVTCKDQSGNKAVGFARVAVSKEMPVASKSNKK